MVREGENEDRGGGHEREIRNGVGDVGRRHMAYGERKRALEGGGDKRKEIRNGVDEDERESTREEGEREEVIKI